MKNKLVRGTGIKLLKFLQVILLPSKSAMNKTQKIRNLMKVYLMILVLVRPYF